MRWGNPGTDYDATKILDPLDRAIALAPCYDGSYYTKGYHLALSQRFDEAIRVANAGLAVNPNNPRFYDVRGRRKYPSAVSTRQNPTSNRRFG